MVIGALILKQPCVHLVFTGGLRLFLLGGRSFLHLSQVHRRDTYRVWDGPIISIAILSTPLLGKKKTTQSLKEQKQWCNIGKSG